MAVVNQLRFEKIRKQIRYCFDNEYFGARFRDAGVSHPAEIESFEQFRSLPPFMTKASHRETQQQSLEKYGHPFGLHLTAPLEHVMHVAGTSGTTGLPTFYLFTRRDLERTYLTLGRMFEAAGIRPGDSVLHLFGLRSCRLSSPTGLDPFHSVRRQVWARPYST
jgi:phenylacetate-CoA ligase